MRTKSLESESAETTDMAVVPKAAGTDETTAEPEAEKTAEITNYCKRIYIGPTIKGVVNGTVFKGDLPPMLKEAIGAMPAIGELVVPVTNLTAANRELTNPKSALSRFYDMVKFGRGE